VPGGGAVPGEQGVTSSGRCVPARIRNRDVISHHCAIVQHDRELSFPGRIEGAVRRFSCPPAGQKCYRGAPAGNGRAFRDRRDRD
jgi:hypothetical protein